MSVKTCKVCGSPLLQGLNVCHNCGTKQNRRGILSWIFLLIIASFIIGMGVSIIDNNIKPPPKPTAEESRRQAIEKQFSAWDGAHIKLERYIKTIMNDPDSYEHVKTIYWDKGDHLLVRTTFRGRNAFGGLVLNTITAKVDIDGNVIEIISQTP